MADYIEQKHISKFMKEMKAVLAEQGVFNPKNYVSKDALIVACAKSKPVDVVLTSDKNTFVPIAKQVNLPVLKTEDIPWDLHENIDYQNPIPTNY